MHVLYGRCMPCTLLWWVPEKKIEHALQYGYNITKSKYSVK